MLKAPWPGFVKTRLAEHVGPSEASRIYRLMVERLAKNLPSEFPVEIHFTPASAEAEFAAWLGRVGPLFPQSDGDLGARLTAAMHGTTARGARGIVFLGGDCPYVDAQLLQDAAASMASSDVVIGPATDGGYYLLGINKPEESLFEGIPWSTSRVLQVTLMRIKALHWTHLLLPELEDIDDIESWNRARVLFVDPACDLRSGRTFRKLDVI